MIITWFSHNLTCRNYTIWQPCQRGKQSPSLINWYEWSNDKNSIWLDFKGIWNTSWQLDLFKDVREYNYFESNLNKNTNQVCYDEQCIWTGTYWTNWNGKSTHTFIRPLVLSSSYLTLLPFPISTTCAEIQSWIWKPENFLRYNIWFFIYWEDIHCTRLNYNKTAFRESLT